MNLLNYAFSQHFMYFWIYLKFLCSWFFSFYFGNAILKWGLFEWNFQTLNHGQNSPIVFQFCPIFWKIIWSPCWCNEACFNLILERFFDQRVYFWHICILEMMNIEVSCCNYPYHVSFEFAVPLIQQKVPEVLALHYLLIHITMLGWGPLKRAVFPL